jgi:hypothetical protein
MTFAGESVLGFARNSVLLGEDLRTFTKRNCSLGGHRRIHHSPAKSRRVQFGVSAWQHFFSLRQDPRRTAHRLNAARDGHVRVADFQRSTDLDHRFHSRSAQSIDRCTGHRDREAGQQDRHARDVAIVLPGTVRITENDVVDSSGIKFPMSIEKRSKRPGREIVRPNT